MILVFGGTTEGRMAAKVLDESGAIYYYSTRSDMQDIQLAHGVRLTGTMELAQMKAFCHEQGLGSSLPLRTCHDDGLPFLTRSECLHIAKARVLTEHDL